MSTWTLYYDGGCNLCHASKLRVEAWAQKVGQPLNVDVLLSDAAIAKGYAGDAMILEADGEVLTGADAWLKMMSISPWYSRWIAWMAKTRFTRALARWGYGIVAKYRYKIFGTRACAIPSAVQPGFQPDKH